MGSATDTGRRDEHGLPQGCDAIRTGQSREIASAIYTRLPLEIRDRVYAFCIQEGSYDNEVIIRRSLAHKQHAFSFLVREPLGPHSYVWVEDPITATLRAKHMSTAVAREMLETYYWTRVFKFSHRELDLLAPFLRTDVFGLGRLPVIYARRLHLQIRPFAHAARRMRAHDAAEQQKCHQAIAALAAISTPRTEVIVQFDLEQDLLDRAVSDPFPPEDERFLLKLMRDLIALKDRGLRIEIAFSGSWNGHSSTRIRSRSMCSPEECMMRMTKAAHAQHACFGGIS